MKNFISKFYSAKAIVFFILSFASFFLMYLNALTNSQASVLDSISDQNDDGVINLTDVRILTPINEFECTLCADVNGDKQINDIDTNLVKYQIDILADNEDKTSFNSRFDINNDGVLDDSDLNILEDFKGKTVNTPQFGLDDPSEITFGYQDDHLTIKYKSDTQDSFKQTIISSLSLNKVNEYSASTTEVITKDNNDLESLKKEIEKEANVEKVYKEYVSEPAAPNDEAWINQWNVRKIRTEETWYTETTGSNSIGVAVYDTGFNVNHPDFTKNVSSTRRNLNSTNPNEDEYTDVSGNERHGMEVAGIISAEVDNNEAIAGLMKNVDLIPIKYGGSNSLKRGAEWVLTKPQIKVLNLSVCLGYNSPENYNSYDAITELANSGVIIIASAGNDGRNDMCYPANHPKVIGVGATKSDDSLWSNSSGRVDADVFAPGNCISTLNEFSWVGCVDGTSLAAPHVSAVAAMCLTVKAVNDIPQNCKRFEKTAYGRIDMWGSVWYRNCRKFNFDNRNNVIDSTDAQKLGFRVNQPNLYNVLYDIYPAGTDGVINISDALLILDKGGYRCQ